MSNQSGLHAEFDIEGNCVDIMMGKSLIVTLPVDESWGEHPDPDMVAAAFLSRAFSAAKNSYNEY